MAGSLRLDDLLSSLCTEAQKDSSGAFTMDATTAMEKLRQFQLADIRKCWQSCWSTCAEKGIGS